MGNKIGYQSRERKIIEEEMMILNRANGCMVGGAYGDSLGAPVEFLNILEIRKCYGVAGINQLAPFGGFLAGSITDDTQMALATGRGLLEFAKSSDDIEKDPSFAIWRSYLEWFESQSNSYYRRAPGNTCLAALETSRMGSIDKPLNNSAGCGAIMRAHPIGLFSSSSESAFQLGMKSGAITHGHPNGYIPAGYLAALIAELMTEKGLEESIEIATACLQSIPNELANEVELAVSRAQCASRNRDTSEVIDLEIGGSGGWQGHDALAISLYACLCAPTDPIRAVQIAVNHSGDSDSTGAIAGAIMGAIHGSEVFDKALTQQNVSLECAQELNCVAISLIQLDNRHLF